MNARARIIDKSANHSGYRSPGFKVLGRYDATGIFDELLGCKRFHEQAERLARSCARGSRFATIVIQ